MYREVEKGFFLGTLLTLALDGGDALFPSPLTGEGRVRVKKLRWKSRDSSRFFRGLRRGVE